MYGLINRGLRSLIVEQHGEAVWDEICREVDGVPVEFMAMAPYGDEVTYALVGAASRHLQVSAEELLRSFGRHWVTFTAKQGYGEILSCSGRNLRQFLRGLDGMHTRIGGAFGALEAPSFRVSDATETSLVLDYVSSREGLAPLVVGLLEGLAQMFDTTVSIEQIAAKADGAPADRFLVHHDPIPLRR